MAATVRDHLKDDPLVLVLLVSRRLPDRIARAVAPVISGFGHAAKNPVVLALACLISGDSQAVKQTIESNLFGSPRRKRLLTEIALAADLPECADELLARIPAGARGLAGTTARRYWYDGRMTDAVAALDGLDGQRPFANRLRSELTVFRGWSPSAVPVAHYEPKPASMLYVLTNSLPHTESGYAQRSHSVLLALRNLGWSVSAVTRLGYPVQVGKIAAKRLDTVDGINYYRLLPARLNTGMDQRLQQQAELLLDLCLQLRPAVLHTTTHFVNGLVVRTVAEALGIPWVYEVRGQLADTWASRRSPSALRSERYKLFNDREAEVSQTADLVLTLGEAMKRRLTDQGVEPENVLLYPNAVGDEFLKDPIDARNARTILGLPEEGTFVGTVSSLVDYEGLDTLLRAVALLAADYPQLRCLIVGDGAAASSLQLLAKELGVDNQTIFSGRVPRARAHLYHQALDVFVIPRRDTDVTQAVTPLKPVEAMASGRAVIFSDLQALRETVPRGAGTAVVAEDPVALAGAITRYIEAPFVGREHGTAGRNYALSQMTWSVGALTLLDGYRAIGVLTA